MSISVRDDPEHDRYAAFDDGELAAFVRYRREGEVVDLVHTETLPGHTGHGVASDLIAEVLDDVRERGGAVRPYCPFVRGYLVKHPELRDLVPATERAQFALDD